MACTALGILYIFDAFKAPHEQEIFEMSNENTLHAGMDLSFGDEYLGLVFSYFTSKDKKREIKIFDF